ncbi:MAG: outer membrane lipoprotein-sorting protein [Methanosarcinaceae archaeon]
MIKTRVVLMLLLISSSLFVTGCIDEGLTAEQIAEKMQQKQDIIEDYSFTMYMTMDLGDQEMVMETDMMYKKPNKMKTVVKQPAEAAGGVSVSDGKTMWIYEPQQNTVMIMDMLDIPEQSELDYLNLVEMMLNESDFSLAGVENFDGRTTYVIDMSPKNNSDMSIFGDMKVWVDQETWMPLKMDMNDADGNPMYSMEYRNFQINTGIPDSEFQFEIPEGAEVHTMDMDELFVPPQAMTLEEVREEAKFDILVPSYLPDGYEFDNAIATEGFSEMVSLNYKNGDQRLGITEIAFENEPQLSPIMANAEVVSINGVEGKFALVFGSNMLQWEIGNIQITLSGSIDKDELIHVAEEMQ